MEKKLYVCIAPGGLRFIGLKCSIVNPCGDHWNPNDCYETYENESGYKFTNVEVVREIVPFDVYEKDDDGKYVKVVPQKVTQEKVLVDGIDGQFYAPESSVRQLSTDPKEVIEADMAVNYGIIIRRWLFLNVECTMPVYIDENHDLHTEGDVTIFTPCEEFKYKFVHIGGNLIFK